MNRERNPERRREPVEGLGAKSHDPGTENEEPEEHELTAKDFVVDEFELYGLGD